VRSSGTSVGQVCRELALTDTAVRHWVVQAAIDAAERPHLATAEREELAQRRRELRVLWKERHREKAAAFFAEETTR